MVAPPPVAEARRGGDDQGVAHKGTGQGGPSFDQLNRDLKRKVDETNPQRRLRRLWMRARRTPKIGVVNIPGVQQQYGKNFGHSVYPYRPSSPVFSPPIGPRH